MRLIEAWNCDLEKEYELIMSFLPNENGFENPAYGMSFEQFKEYVDTKKLHSQGLNLPEGYVPDTMYILEDDEGNYVGRFNLRHCLNDFLEKGPGHIGYGISKKYRGKGYACEGLRLTLQKAKEKGIKVAYLSCNIDNLTSLHVQLHNGAYIDHQDEHSYYTRIKLD